MQQQQQQEIKDLELMPKEVIDKYYTEKDITVNLDKPDLKSNEEYMDDTVLGDSYDLYNLATKVHSPMPEFNRDFTLASFETEVLTNKLTRFITEQMKVVRSIELFLIPQKDVLEKRFGKEKAMKMYNHCIMNAYKIKRLLLAEIYSNTILSRSMKGNAKLIDGIIEHGRAVGKDNEGEDLGKEESIMTNLTKPEQGVVNK